MKNIEKTKKVLGIILLLPALFSVALFFIDFFVELIDGSSLLEYAFEWNSVWSGDTSGDGGGFTPALPLYFGLMAIAGALLLFNVKNTDK